MSSRRWSSGRVLLGLAVFIAVLESASYAAIAFLNQRLRPPIVRTPALYDVVRRGALARLAQYETPYELDTLLGWRYTTGYHFGFHGLNAQGLRSAREYDTLPRPGTARVAAFGDSFVYGDEVAAGDAWPARIEADFPGIEMLNYGVRGYGTDQALLRYRLEGHALHPRVVLLGFIPDDLGRLVSVFRPFWTPEIPAFSKPRFVLGPDDSLRLVPSPIRGDADYRRLLERPGELRALGAMDAWYEPLVYANPLYDWSATVRLVTAVWIRLKRDHLSPDRLVRDGVLNDHSESYRLQMKVFAAFRREAQALHEEPIVLLLPDRHTVEQLRAGQMPIYAPLARDLARDSIPFLDVGDAFRAQPASADVGRWFEYQGHYSPAGNEIVAQWLGSRLTGRHAP